MKKQCGFSLVVVLVATAASAAIIASGYVVYKESQKDNEDKSKTSQTVSKNSTPSKTQNNTSSTSRPNYTIRYINPSDPDTGLILYTEADFAKLPADFPSGAISYMRQKIGKTDHTMVQNECTQVYSIIKYNDVNVSGGDISVDANKEVCPGGAAAILSLDTTNNWRLTGFQSVLGCDVLIAAKIYKDFLSECYDDKNSNNPNDDQLVDNPNGNSTDL